MPELPFGVILFCLISALGFSGAALRLLNRKTGASRRQPMSFPAAFLAGSVTFSLIYGLNRLAFPARPEATAVCNLLILACLLAFPELKKKIRGLRPKNMKHDRLRLEAAALEHMLELDPLNAFCFEKLSEIYEKIGAHAQALEAASEAVKLDPSADNRFRLEELRNKIQPREEE